MFIGRYKLKKYLYKPAFSGDTGIKMDNEPNQGLAERLKTELPIVESTSECLEKMEEFSNELSEIKQKELTKKAELIEQEENLNTLIRHKTIECYTSLERIMRSPEFSTYRDFNHSFQFYNGAFHPVKNYVALRKNDSKMNLFIKYQQYLSDSGRNSPEYRNIDLTCELKEGNFNVDLSMESSNFVTVPYKFLLSSVIGGILGYYLSSKNLYWTAAATISGLLLGIVGDLIKEDKKSSKKFDLKEMPDVIKERTWQFEVLRQITKIPGYLEQVAKGDLYERKTSLRTNQYKIEDLQKQHNELSGLGQTV